MLVLTLQKFDKIGKFLKGSVDRNECFSTDGGIISELPLSRICVLIFSKNKSPSKEKNNEIEYIAYLFRRNSVCERLLNIYSLCLNDKQKFQL